MNTKLLETLTNAPGIAGHEEKIFKILKDELHTSVDSITSDNLGSFISKKEGSSDVNVALVAHMDEVGFMLNEITEHGFAKFSAVGGWFDQVLLGQRVKLITYTNDEYIGVIGCKAPHILSEAERGQVVKLENMFIDFGFKNKEDAQNRGVFVGDMIVPIGDLFHLADEDLVAAKALDNRVGCYIMAQVMKNIEAANLKVNVFGCASVQEEVGLRGAGTLANQIKPDISIAIDTSVAKDTPDMSQRATALKDGVMLMVRDGSAIANPKLMHYITKMASKNDIKLQYDMLARGGTDTGKIHVSGNGVIALSLVISTRYLHTHTSVVSMQDVNGCIELLTQVILDLDEVRFTALSHE